jgi:predicted mannosyl-3-phosphoglycerate phosphatase (HAD superfamily)|tara:strand:- start:19636 stop:20031 length:396 start_codon:yes stop_codon:yes gene_type:complete
MDGLKERGISYISNRTVINNDAVMFDIDDTLIFTSGRLNVPIYELLIIAKRMGYKIIIITARPSFEAIVELTRSQLQNFGIVYDYLGFTSHETKDNMKKALGYNFVLSVGDMDTDLTHSQHVLNTSNFYHS